jgi:hypothetical protein
MSGNLALVRDRDSAVFAQSASISGRRQIGRFHHSLGSLARVRWIVAIALMLGVLGCVACQFDMTAQLSKNQLATTQWRRTASGWERLITRSLPIQSNQAEELWLCHLHPIVLTLLEGMLSVLVLVAFSPSEQSYNPERPSFPGKPQEIVTKFGEIELRSRSWLTDSSGC